MTAMPVRMDDHILPFQNELDGQAADLEKFSDAEANRQRQLVLVISLPVDQDVRSRADLPLTREKLPDEILDVGLAGRFAVVVKIKIKRQEVAFSKRMNRKWWIVCRPRLPYSLKLRHDKSDSVLRATTGQGSPTY